MAEDGQFGAVAEAAADPPPPLPPEEPHDGGGGGPPPPCEPIAAGLGVDYAFPPHLEYAYPPPDGNILTNIVNALIAAPRFYTQVLHLMNKMNLPAPFRPALPTPPLPNPAPSRAQPVLKRQAGDLSSGESELESSEEDDDDDESENAAKEFDETRQGAKQAGGKKGRVKKRAKTGAILGPAVDKGASHEAAGVRAIVVPKAPRAMKKKAPVLQIKIAPKGSTSDVEPRNNSAANEDGGVVLAEARQADDEQQLATASREELEAGKLAPSDMLALPIFRKYAPGNPTPVLYIKNLAKDVTPDDMYYIYGAFFSGRAAAVARLSVKVMQEGRMRGQAFVCLPSTELAKVALAGTHGFVFKGKPMVVQYGHNETVTKTSNPTEETRK